jgi:hypothetical protein
MCRFFFPLYNLSPPDPFCNPGPLGKSLLSETPCLAWPFFFSRSSTKPAALGGQTVRVHAPWRRHTDPGGRAARDVDGRFAVRGEDGWGERKEGVFEMM